MHSGKLALIKRKCIKLCGFWATSALIWAASRIFAVRRFLFDIGAANIFIMNKSFKKNLCGCLEKEPRRRCRHECPHEAPQPRRKTRFVITATSEEFLKLLRGNQGRSSTKVLISGLILSSFGPPRQKFGLSAEALWIS